MAHVAQWKYREVEELVSIITKYPVLGIVEIGSIPAPQLQQMRESIRKIGVLRVARNKLIKRALEEANKKLDGIAHLGDTMQGETAILATNVNPFKLFKLLKETKTNAPAKGGEIAPHDIEVKAGETPFKPGPIVGELQKVGIPAAIEGGKVVIKKDKVVVPAGEKISPQLAQMLTRLEIYPIEIGMKLHAVYEGGEIFTPDVLDIDMDKFMSDLARAYQDAFALAVSQSWITPQTIKSLIIKAQREAFAVGLEISYPSKDILEQLILKAHAQSNVLASRLKNT